MQSTAEDSPVDATQPSEPGPLSTEQINLVDEPEAGAQILKNRKQNPN